MKYFLSIHKTVFDLLVFALFMVGTKEIRGTFCFAYILGLLPLYKGK